MEERHLDSGSTEANSLLPAAWTSDRFAKVGPCGGSACTVAVDADGSLAKPLLGPAMLLDCLQQCDMILQHW
jgi:hypothetical protein